MARSALRAREAASGRRGSGVATSLILDSLGSAADNNWSVKKRRAAYTGPAFRIQRVSDNTQVDIAFTSGGVADASAIATFCSGTTGYVCKWYDQKANWTGSGTDGVDLAETSTTHMPRIYASGAVDGVATFGFPAPYAPDTARGMTSATLSSYAGTTISVAVVGVLSSGTTTASPRFFSRFGASNSDANDNQGFFIGRNDTSGVAAQQWAVKRSNGARAIAAATYDQLSQVDSVINGAGYDIEVDGTTGTGNVSLSAFGSTRFSIGYSGGGYQSVAGQYWVDIIYSVSAWNSTQRTAIRADQHTVFGTRTPAVPGAGSLNYVGSKICGDYFDSGSYDLANFTIGNNGTMTSQAGAWMSRNVDVSGGALRLRYIKNATTQNNGSINYLREGGYVIYKGPGNAAQARGGVWRWKEQSPSGTTTGLGEVPLLWFTTGSWTKNGEVDFPERYSTSNFTNAGEANIHYDGVNGTDIKLHLPSSGTFAVDFTQPHIFAIAWYPGSDSAGTGCFLKFYVDDVLVASTTDPTHVMHGVTAVAMRLTFQQECYGTTDAAAVSGPLYWLISFVEFYNLP